MHFQKFRFDQIQKWPPIGHYSLSHGRYLVNRARWLDHYYRMKCEISSEDASWKFRLDQIQNGPLSAIIYFHMPNILQTVLDASPLL